MKNNNILYIFLVLFLIGSCFYWFELRPSKIRSYCDWSIRWGPNKPKPLTGEIYDFFYKSCLRSKGISN